MQVLDRVTAAHEKLEFGESGRAFYDFFWAQYADWYIESAKTRLYSRDPEIAQTTRKVSSAPKACICIRGATQSFADDADGPRGSA